MSRKSSLDGSAGTAAAGLTPQWRDQLITAVAASLAVLVVAAVAVLMSMA